MELLDLVTRAQSGDEQAFASLAVAVGGRLHAVSKRILRDADLAEDATQQALLTIWRQLPRLRDPHRFEAWAYRVLVRACYAEGRTKRRWAPNLHALADVIPADADAFAAVRDRDQVERGFRQLSVEHRAVLVLRYYLDLSPDEIAETLGIPAGTIRSRLFYGMQSLRAALDADERPRAREAVR
ncbi:MAG TPA: RNA polymerase sigma factor [Candidatus Limnocylindrales bacterium]|nr:RNA polymerase sigma factor [Candidatus Limnocylindrales bacterium]